MLISVITCAHNPRPAYLKRVLNALKGQNLPTTDWEYLLIDNASKEPLARKYTVDWNPSGRVIRVDELGLTAARLRGIREARGELLVFVDDDNVLDSNFLKEALLLFEDKAWIGAASGQCRAEFESPAPEWTRPFWPALVVREFNEDRWSNLPHLHDSMPHGAGLCVRREVARHYLSLHNERKRVMKLDRTGTRLLSGGDNDLAACACDIGLGMGLFRELRLTHLIPPERLNEDYLVRLVEGIAYSGVFVSSFRGYTHPTPSLGRRILDLVKLPFMRRINRQIVQANRRGLIKGQKDLAESCGVYRDQRNAA